MFKDKRITYSLTFIPLVIILILFMWLFAIIFEGERPIITLEPLPEFLSGSQKFKIKISDMKRGLKMLRVSYSQGGREVTLFEKRFPFEGLFNREGIHHFEHEIDIDPIALHLSQGRLDLNARVWDYSRRGGGDGNITLAHHKMTVDTIPPAIRAISRMHNINRGGTGLVVYQTSSDTSKSGVYVSDRFFPGFPVDNSSDKGIHVSYFAIPHNSSLKPSIFLWAKDRAENTSRSTFYNHVRRKRFGKERINITDRFLKRVLPYFYFFKLDSEESDIKKYLKINNDLRKEDNEKFLKLMEEVSPKKLWEGSWLRLKNAASMAGFAVQRSYYYKGEKVDEQFHLGIDLASLSNSNVHAANHGRVLFAERNGIYGLTVVLDHGQGLASLYGHLSHIEVKPGQDVKKGDFIGITGQTGLAGGDHLHFSVLVNGVFVNPIEWWDSHWIKDNITRKLDLIK